MSADTLGGAALHARVAHLFACVLLIGCGASPIEQAIRSARPLVVDEVELVGVTRFDKEIFLSYLNLGETSIWPWGDTARYGPALIETDRQRIVELYAAFGHHDAEVLALRIEQPDPESDRVRVVVEVREGPLTRLKGVDLDGSPLPDTEPPMKVGKPFEIERFQAAETALRRRLLDKGYGHAKVKGAAEVDRDARAAHVRFDVEPGPKLTISTVIIEGLETVPEYLVRREVVFAEGSPWRPAIVERVEQSVYALEMFSTVVAELADERPDGTVVLRVRVRERQADDLKIGVGLGFQPERWEERITALYRHRNLFGNLTRLRLKVRVGWAQLPTPWDVNTNGPLVGVAPTFEKKGLLEPQLLWTLAPAFDLGIEPGYRFYRLRGQVGVSRFFFGKLRLTLRQTVEYFDFFAIEAALDANRTALGRDFRDPYLLSYPSAEAKLFLTNDLFQPTNGVILGITHDLAGGPFLGDFNFQRITPSIQAWWRPGGAIQFAGRLEAGMILPYGELAGAPLSLKYKLGGANTVRGWGAERLSPQVFDCPPNECKGIPVGGNTMILGTFEVRVPITGPLELATFLDMGDVQEGELQWRPDEWNYASGGGLRVVTPIGRLRLDLGVRLNTPERFAREDRWALHLALGEAF